jgi:hypothetical protein
VIVLDTSVVSELRSATFSPPASAAASAISSDRKVSARPAREAGVCPLPWVTGPSLRQMVSHTCFPAPAAGGPARISISTLTLIALGAGS